LQQQESPTILATYDPYATLSLRVAEAIKEQLKLAPGSRLGLPTGRTPIECYRILSQWSKNGQLDWSKVKAFGLDEYYDVDESATFLRFLENNLYCSTNLPAGSRYNPLFCDNYDEVIANAGGLDLTILGIGTNGHIAFNEPGTPLDSWTHSIWLTESTKQANSEFFQGTIPEHAATMGIQTILGSRKIILMASGEKKRKILQAALRGPVTPQVPASFLQSHKNLLVMTDFDF